MPDCASPLKTGHPLVNGAARAARPVKFPDTGFPFILRAA